MGEAYPPPWLPMTKVRVHLSKDVKAELTKTNDATAAAKLGAVIAKKALEKGITTVVFDRGGFIYQGKVKALAEAAREAGLNF
jgi:large subunit ribosomal protein L18